VGSIMTPIADVFTMPCDQVLDEATMNQISAYGYSRIPIHAKSQPTNFIGMLLVKTLITYDPEDCRRVEEFPLATLPETRPDTSALDILNFFQEGKSHMVLVSEDPGENYGALGVLTLEDVVEELIGEEIIDESDVYIDVHKAIRRLQPGPMGRNAVYNAHVFTPHPQREASFDLGDAQRPKPLLGPSNAARNPKPTARKNVTIKSAAYEDHLIQHQSESPNVTKRVRSQGFATENDVRDANAQDVMDTDHFYSSNGHATSLGYHSNNQVLHPKVRTGSIKEHTKNDKIVIETEPDSDSEVLDSTTDDEHHLISPLRRPSPSSRSSFVQNPKSGSSPSGRRGS